MRAMLDHRHVREARTCPICNREKESGLLLCWPCYHAIDARGGLRPAIVAIIDNAEAALSQGEADPARPAPLTPEAARTALDALQPAACVSISARQSQTFGPAIVCWRCEEAAPLDLESIRGFAKAHTHAHDDDDPTIRPCPHCPGTPDRIGEDTHGRPYWFCANCGTEFQTDPE